MSKISTPHNGQNILQWARQVTHEVNSLQPTGSSNVNVTKTGEGTTISVKESALGKPDSTPANIGGTAQSGYTTTHSIEKNEQGALSLFEFGKGERTEYEGSDIPRLDLLVRDKTTETVDGGPTLRYIQASLLKDVPDSEAESVVGNSIDHNSESALEVYHFENVGENDKYNPATATDPSLRGSYILVRVHESGGVPTVKYMNIKGYTTFVNNQGGGGTSSVSVDCDTGTVGKSIDWNTEGEVEIHDFEQKNKHISKTNFNSSGNNKEFLIRVSDNTDQNSVPELMYIRWSDLIDIISDNVSTTGYTGTETVVTDTRYDTSSHYLEKRTSTYTYVNGLVTSVTDNGWSTITQAVAEEL